MLYSSPRYSHGRLCVAHLKIIFLLLLVRLPDFISLYAAINTLTNPQTYTYTHISTYIRVDAYVLVHILALYSNDAEFVRDSFRLAALDGRRDPSVLRLALPVGRGLLLLLLVPVLLLVLLLLLAISSENNLNFYPILVFILSLHFVVCVPIFFFFSFFGIFPLCGLPMYT